MMENQMPDLTNFAATVAEAMGLEKDAHMSDSVKSLAQKILAAAGGEIEKALFFHADAVPAYAVNKYEEIFAPVKSRTDWVIPFRAVMPSITPVCFAAMFSGTYPDRNGVPKYVTPMIREDLVQPSICTTTLIDILVKAGKKVAVVTCENGCIASMLYNRGETLKIIPNDDNDEIFNEAYRTLESGEFDAVFVYQFSYDHTMHRYGPESEEALGELKVLTDRFAALSDLAHKIWADKRTLTVFNADHGAHTTVSGGSHGEDRPEDMDMLWFFGACAAK